MIFKSYICYLVKVIFKYSFQNRSALLFLTEKFQFSDKIFTQHLRTKLLVQTGIRARTGFFRYNRPIHRTTQSSARYRIRILSCMVSYKSAGYYDVYIPRPTEMQLYIQCISRRSRRVFPIRRRRKGLQEIYVDEILTGKKRATGSLCCYFAHLDLAL